MTHGSEPRPRTAARATPAWVEQAVIGIVEGWAIFADVAWSHQPELPGQEVANGTVATRASGGREHPEHDEETTTAPTTRARRQRWPSQPAATRGIAATTPLLGTDAGLDDVGRFVPRRVLGSVWPVRRFGTTGTVGAIAALLPGWSGGSSGRHPCGQPRDMRAFGTLAWDSTPDFLATPAGRAGNEAVTTCGCGCEHPLGQLRRAQLGWLSIWARWRRPLKST